MKDRTHLTALSALLASGLVALALPVSAADSIGTPQSHDSSKAWRTEALPTDRTLGHVERANKLIGCEVSTSDNQRFGKIDNIIVDFDTGRILYAVIGTGGFLGAGEHRLAVPPTLFTRIPKDTTTLQLSVDKQMLMNAPKFTAENEQQTELGQVRFVNEVYQYFGQSAWWQSAKAAKIASFQNVHQANDLIGMKVENGSNGQVAKIENVALDLPTGRVVYVILMPDSSLNLGDELYAVPPASLSWNAAQKSLVSDLNKEKLAAAPHFAKSDWASLSNPSWASRVYKYYGQQPYFEKGLEPTGR